MSLCGSLEGLKQAEFWGDVAGGGQCTDMRLEKWEGGSWVTCVGCGLHPKGCEMHLQVSTVASTLDGRMGDEDRWGSEGWRLEALQGEHESPGNAPREGWLPPCASVHWPMAPSEGGGRGLLSLGEAWHLLLLHS